MANARTRYDTISSFMQRQYEAKATVLYNKPAVEIANTPFLFYMLPGMAFRLRGRARDSARALAGAVLWTPFGEPPGNSPWVLVPVVHFLRWDGFAIEAMRFATEGNVRRPVAVANQGPPPEPPAALRWRDNIKALLEKASNLRLR